MADGKDAGMIFPLYIPGDLKEFRAPPLHRAVGETLSGARCESLYRFWDLGKFQAPAR